MSLKPRTSKAAQATSNRKQPASVGGNDSGDGYDDDDDAYDYLLEDLSVWDTMSGHEDCADFDWFIQGMQAKAAKKENYVAVEAEDEQGTVYIINMINKESLLKDVTSEFLGA